MKKIAIILLLLFISCDDKDISILSPASGQIFEECDNICFKGFIEEYFVGPKVWLSSIDGTLYIDAADSQYSEFCTSTLSYGVHTITFSFGDWSDSIDIQVMPFGYSLGRREIVQEEEVTGLTTILQDWERNASPLLSPEEDWEEGGTGFPTIAVKDGTYYLYYVGENLEDIHNIGLAISNDGINFEKYEGNPILSYGLSGEWDDFTITMPSVLYRNGVFMLWYSGAGENVSIGYAESVDGIHFEKYEGNPVLESDPEIEGTGIAHPTVIHNGSFFEMWFTGSTGVISYAVSTDGLSWERYCKNPVFRGDPDTWDDEGVKSPEVLLHGGIYLLYYGGQNSEGRWQIGSTFSRDGTHLYPSIHNPVFTYGDIGDFDGFGVLNPFIIEEDGDLRMWYSGGDGAVKRIGYAETPLFF